MNLRLYIFVTLFCVSFHSAAGNYEKCYGISKVGLNDGWKKNLNPGKYKSSEDYHGFAWVFTRKGTCEARNGSLTSFPAVNPLTPIAGYDLERTDDGEVILTYERCYGISRIGENDGWEKQINPGKYLSDVDFSGSAWKYVKRGTCTDTYNGSLSPFKGASSPFVEGEYQSESVDGIN